MMLKKKRRQCIKISSSFSPALSSTWKSSPTLVQFGCRLSELFRTQSHLCWKNCTHNHQDQFEFFYLVEKGKLFLKTKKKHEFISTEIVGRFTIYIYRFVLNVHISHCFVEGCKLFYRLISVQFPLEVNFESKFLTETYEIGMKVV